METKVCITCGIEKPLDEFEFRKDTKKYRNTCKLCRKEYCSKWHKDNIDRVRQYNEDNKEYIQERSKKYYENNKEHLKKYSKEFRDSHKDYYLEYNKYYKSTHKDYVSEYNKQYNIDNNERRKKYKKQYHLEHREYERQYSYKLHKYKMKTDKIYKLKMQVRHLIYHSFTRRGYSKNSRTYQILGCDFNTFIGYLLNTFKENYGYEWDGKEPVHIDHIIPLATAHTEEEVIKLCHYTNLQLLKAQDNLDKSDKEEWKKGGNKNA